MRRLAALDGDGDAELLARGGDGLHTWRWADGWTEAGPVQTLRPRAQQERVSFARLALGVADRQAVARAELRLDLGEGSGSGACWWGVISLSCSFG
jgi:hypothetical protein